MLLTKSGTYIADTVRLEESENRCKIFEKLILEKLSKNKAVEKSRCSQLSELSCLKKRSHNYRFQNLFYVLEKTPRTSQEKIFSWLALFVVKFQVAKHREKRDFENFSTSPLRKFQSMLLKNSHNEYFFKVFSGVSCKFASIPEKISPLPIVFILDV